MLTATPKHLFSWDYAISAGQETLADIDLGWWGEKATLRIDGKDYKVYRERAFGGRFLMETDGIVVASAEKPSSLRRRVIIAYANASYELKPRDMLTRTFDLYCDGALIGSLSANGLLTRKMTVDLPESLPLPLRVFAVWVTVILWRRDASSGG
jgi:hypothetical protein